MTTMRTAHAQPNPTNAALCASDAMDITDSIGSSTEETLALLFRAAEQHTEDVENDLDVNQPMEDYTIRHPNTVDTADSIQTPMNATYPASKMSAPSQETLCLWNKNRFVRQGWYSAREAATYVEL